MPSSQEPGSATHKAGIRKRWPRVEIRIPVAAQRDASTEPCRRVVADAASVRDDKDDLRRLVEVVMRRRFGNQSYLWNSERAYTGGADATIYDYVTADA